MPKLIEVAPLGRDRTLIKLLYVAGLRISEALGLQKKDVKPGRISVLGKGRRVRTLVVPQPLTEALLSLVAGRDDQAFVFRSKRSDLQLLPRNAQTLIAKIADEAGLVMTPHWLRHSHASHALDNGAPIHLVQKSLGHRNVSTTSRYLHCKPDHGASQFLKEV